MARLSKTDISSITALAHQRGLEPAVVLAVVHVESGGRTGSMVNGRFEPIIRFEGHYFDHRLTHDQRRQARKEGLASPKMGGVANPSTQAARYALIDRASAINRQAALESVSWGVGQVMGAHWKALGYHSVEALVETARSSVSGQVKLMLDFIDHNGLKPALAARDWAEFARRYNGPAYARNRYDEKMAKAYDRYRSQLADAVGPSGPERPHEPETKLLRRGIRGQAVQLMQAQLRMAGYDLAADGIFGPVTQHTVRQFQKTHGLRSDGIHGPQTARILDVIAADTVRGRFRSSRLYAWFRFAARLFRKGA